MHNGIRKLEQIIDEIESNITENIDFSELSRKMGISLYEFRRIFSFVVGCPLSEYVRKRRLSLAACEISSDKAVSLLKISEKYGYSTEAAFSKAFRDQHGISPAVCQRGGAPIKLFTRPKFEFSLGGRSTVSLSVIEDGEFSIHGLVTTSPYTDTCCCDAAWNEFYDSGADGKISGDTIYASYHSLGDNVVCAIGERRRADADSEIIPAATWVCFTMDTTDDDVVNKKYSEILYELLPSANMRRREGIPTLEVFPVDMSKDGFEWEIRIPVERI